MRTECFQPLDQVLKTWEPVQQVRVTEEDQLLQHQLPSSHQLSHKLLRPLLQLLLEVNAERRGAKAQSLITPVNHQLTLVNHLLTPVNHQLIHAKLNLNIHAKLNLIIHVNVKNHANQRNHAPQWRNVSENAHQLNLSARNQLYPLSTRKLPQLKLKMLKTISRLLQSMLNCAKSTRLLTLTLKDSNVARKKSPKTLLKLSAFKVTLTRLMLILLSSRSTTRFKIARSISWDLAHVTQINLASQRNHARRLSQFARVRRDVSLWRNASLRRVAGLTRVASPRRNVSLWRNASLRRSPADKAVTLHHATAQVTTPADVHHPAILTTGTAKIGATMTTHALTKTAVEVAMIGTGMTPASEINQVIKVT